ncbi:hypothetical protein [Microcystis aeruginosa]|uniref:hypothetical protein n=1 Tax=Microcystis aeruginosa TaxID=1126 RepID=UPI000301E4CB|nr:hypothetical protein [Microcystis aeruginosa]
MAVLLANLCQNLRNRAYFNSLVRIFACSIQANITAISGLDILAAVKRTAIPHHATFLGWSLNGVDASPKNA